MGEGIAAPTQQKIRRIVESDASIEKVLQVFSTYQSTEDVMLLLLVRFKPDIDTQDMYVDIERIKTRIMSEFPFAHYKDYHLWIIIFIRKIPSACG